jgi:hypothetical protein
VVGNVERLSVILSRAVVGRVIFTWREKIGKVGLPQANVDVQGRGKGRNLHVVGPLARLTHLLDMVLELLLQLLLGVVGGVDVGGRGGGGLAFWVSADAVDSHVLAIEVGICLHVLYSLCPEDLVHFLVAVELVREGVEQAVTWPGISNELRAKNAGNRTIAADVARIQAIGVKDGELWRGSSAFAGRHGAR